MIELFLLASFLGVFDEDEPEKQTHITVTREDMESSRRYMKCCLLILGPVFALFPLLWLAGYYA